MLRAELGWVDIIKAEPVIPSIIDRARRAAVAGMHPTLAYELGKKDAKFYVGWNAEKKELRNSKCYEIFIGKLAAAVGL